MLEINTHEKILMVRRTNYGKIMKNLRTENLYSQAFIAEKMGLKRSTYKEYELQNSIIPIIHLNEFCNFFNVSIDYILGLTSKTNYENSKIEIDKKTSGQRLKELRKKYKLTQKELAKVLNVDISLPSKYEHGIYPIATTYLYSLCKKYNVSADYLLGKTNHLHI